MDDFCDHYTLELARLADAAHLASLSQEHVETGLKPAWTSSRVTWHIRHPDSVVLVARQSGPLQQSATARPSSTAPGPAPQSNATRHSGVAGFAIMRYSEDVAHLNLLAVDPAHRRRGVARNLMAWLEETAFTAGTFIIGLELRATNDAAFAFYSSLGYRELGRVPGYYQGVEPAIRMARDVRAGGGAGMPQPARGRLTSQD